MVKTFRVFSGADFLGSRGKANSIVQEVRKLLEAYPHGNIEIDFSDISGMSHSFTDELLTALNEVLQDEITDRIIITNCGPRARETVELICDMHRLRCPQLRSPSQQTASRFSIVGNRPV